MLTKLRVAQEVANLAVSVTVTRFTSSLITENSDHEEDEISVRVVSGVAGWYVASRVRVHTDAAVEKAALWINSKRNKQDTPEVVA